VRPVFIAGALFFCACRAPAPGRVEVELRSPIIDVHTHTEFSGGSEPNSGIALTREQYFLELERAGAVGAIAHTSTSGARYEDLRGRGVLHCAGVPAAGDLSEIEAGLKSGKYACLKIYLGYVHQYAAAYEAAYTLAARYDVPVVFHTGDTYSTKALLKYADPMTIDEVAVAHPELRLVIAHCGNPWIQTAAEVAYKNPNVYLECSAMLIGDLKNEAAVDRYLVQPISWIFGYLEDPTKMMFGSDWPLVSIADYAEAYRRAIPPEHQRAVFYENAVRVFRWSK
jgi:uncharacterized protein